jgi:hypothetical protein
MVRVFQKRNIGMTDEQLLAYYFGVDIVQKGAMVYSLRGQNASLLKQLKSMSSVTSSHPPRQQAQEPQQQAQEPQQQAPQQEPQREYVEPDEIKVERDYVEAEVVEAKPKAQPKKPKPTSGLPAFGDESVLQHMEDLANGGSPKRTNRKRK